MATKKEVSEIKLRGVSSVLKSELKTISDNMGLTVSGFIKTKLRDIVDSTPEHMRQQRLS